MTIGEFFTGLFNAPMQTVQTQAPVVQPQQPQQPMQTVQTQAPQQTIQQQPGGISVVPVLPARSPWDEVQAAITNALAMNPRLTYAGASRVALQTLKSGPGDLVGLPAS